MRTLDTTITTADGTIIAYRDLGPLDGRPIMLCHGLAAAGEQFLDDAQAFAARGFRVLVPDLRGHGRSGTPQARRDADFTIPLMAADLLAVLDHAGIARIDWVGNSLGGIVALELLGSAPERIRTLATFGTAYSLSLPGLVAPMLPGLYGVFGKRLVSKVTAFTTTPNKAARLLVERLLADFDPNAGRAIAANVRRYDLIANALGYAGPLLLIRGGRDKAVNAALGPTMAAMAGRPNFHLAHLQDAGHCANLDCPADWRALVEGHMARA